MKDFLEVMEAGEKLETSLSQRAKSIANFDEKLSRFIGLIANQPGYSSHKRAFLMKEAETTSDFPALFGTVLERQLLAKYRVQTPDWRQYIKVGTQRDFRPSWQIGIYGLQANLSVVPQRAEYPAAKLVDGKYVIQLTKYGRTFPLSWEDIINDDLGAFADVADRLANAALRTEFYQATKLITSSGGPNTALYGTSVQHIDGSTVDNVTTLTSNRDDVLTADAIGEAVTKMRQQKDVDGEPIMIDGFELVVPPQLELEAMKALSPAALIARIAATSGPSAQTGYNVVASLGITQHVNPYLPIIDTTYGSTAWYMFAKLSNGAAAQMNFLAGHENPEIVQKLANKVAGGPLEGDFETDSIQWRVRHVLGGTQMDPRFTFASKGTANFS